MKERKYISRKEAEKMHPNEKTIEVWNKLCEVTDNMLLDDLLKVFALYFKDKKCLLSGIIEGELCDGIDWSLQKYWDENH